MRRFALFSLLLAACGGSPTDTGTGTDTLLVDADIDATPEIALASDPIDFTTEMRVRVSLNGTPVTSGTVEIASDAGTVSLAWDGNNNEWRGAQSGYYEVYSLDVISGDDNVRGVQLDGPDIHVFTAPDPTTAVDATVPLTVTWDRADEADAASIRSREMDTLSIPDAGSFEFPALALRNSPDQSEDEEIRVSRQSRIVPDGAVAGSELRVHIENRLDLIVAPTGL